MTVDWMHVTLLGLVICLALWNNVLLNKLMSRDYPEYSHTKWLGRLPHEKPKAEKLEPMNALDADDDPAALVGL